MNARYQPLWACSVVVSLALLSGACTTVHQAPQSGTETGNPPVIDASLISLVVSQDEVHVRGAPGAATPGSTIEAISKLTGAVFRGQAAADGSFDLLVAAPITDSFEVRAIQSGKTSSTVYVVRGGASVGQGSGQALSCRQRDELARAQMSATAESADARCTRDEDCVLAPADTACSDSCADVPVSHSGALELSQARAAIESGLCKDFEADACNFLVLPCVPPASTTVGCRDQRCQLVEPGTPADAGTEPDAGAPLDAGAQADAGPQSCPESIPLAGAACTGTLTCEYGYCVLDWREEATCVEGRWQRRAFSCWTNEWLPIVPLDCSSDFDPGTADGRIPVYWYYPRAGVCVPRTYGGVGGNHNRYETLAACEAACPRSAGECPPDRVETSICVEPGLAGGCARSATGCARLCSEPLQACEGEAGWSCNLLGFCDATAPE